MNEPSPPAPPPPPGETAPPTAPNPHEVWLPTRAASAFLGIGPRRLNQLRKSGDIFARKRGWRGWEFRENDLMAYVETLAGVPSPEPVPDVPPPDHGGLAEMQRMMAEMAKNPPPQPLPDDEAANQSPVVRLTNAIIVNAIDGGASDIHVEPGVRNVRVRNRMDGTLREVMALPLAIKWPVTRRFCIMADLDPFSQRLQMGRIWIKHNDKEFNLRVSFTPTIFGPSLTIRIVDPVKLRVNRLGLTPGTQRLLEDVVYPDLSSGLLLFCGPTGSGLTTTAWALLNKLNSVERKTVSLVPVAEYDVGGIDQILVQNESGVGDVGHHRRPTVGDALSAVLRGDADVVFLGDITGPQTARAALQAAQAGVLTLATINAPSAHLALRRVADFAGVPPENVETECRGVLVQRLVRRLNPDTRQARQTFLYELEQWGFPVSQATAGKPLNSPVTVFSPCPADPEKSRYGNTGDQWAGQVGVFAWVAAHEAANADAGRYELRRDAFAKVLEGLLTVEDAGVALR